MTTAGTRVRTFPMDAYRHGEEVVLRFDLPGLDPQSIDLTVDQHVLTVRAERRNEPEEGEEVLASERPQGRSSAASTLATRSTLSGSTPSTATASSP